MRKNSFRSGIAVGLIALMVLMLCTACGQKPKQDAAPQSAEEAYAAFIQDQKGDNAEIYAAIINASEDGAPVLLIGTETMTVGDDAQAIAADVYAYSDGQVVKICGMESGGSAYPIGTVEDKYLVCGSHHSLERCLVSGNAASVEFLSGLAMENPDYTMTTCTITNDEWSNEEEQEISLEDGDAFADAIYEAWVPVTFTKY